MDKSIGGKKRPYPLAADHHLIGSTLPAGRMLEA